MDQAGSGSHAWLTITELMCSCLTAKKNILIVSSHTFLYSTTMYIIPATTMAFVLMVREQLVAA